MAVRLSEIETAFTADDRELKRAYREAEQGAQRVVGNINRAFRGVNMGGGAGGFGAAAGGGGLFSGIGEGLKMLPGLGMIASGLGKIADVMKSGVGMGFDYRRMIEENSLGLTRMMGSADNARKHIAELAGLKTEGIALEDALTGSRRLQAMGFAAKDIPAIMLAIGDAARTTGADFDGVSRAISQMISKGTLNMEELRQQLGERAVPVFKYLTDEVARTDKAFAKLTEPERLARFNKMVERGEVSGRGAAETILRGFQKDYGGMGRQWATTTASGLEMQASESGRELLGKAFGNVFEGYKSMLQGGVNLMASETVQSLAEGFNAKSGELMEAGVNAAKWLEKGYRDYAQQHSPSELFKGLGFDAGGSLAFGFQEGARRGMGGVKFDDEIEKLIEENARRAGIDPNLLRAVIQQESGGRRRAVSSAGAQGVMQLMPGTAARFGVTNPFDAAQSIRGGTDYLRQLLDMFGGRVDLALAGYNWGEHRKTLRKAHETGRPVTDFAIPAETRNYVNSIQGAYGRMGMQEGLSGASGGSTRRGLVSKIDEGMYFVSAGGEVYQLTNQWPSGTQGVGMPQQLRNKIGNVSDLAGLAANMGGMTNAQTLAGEWQGLRSRSRGEHGGVPVRVENFSEFGRELQKFPVFENGRLAGYDTADTPITMDALRRMMSGASGPISTSATISNEGVMLRELQGLPGAFGQAAAGAAGLNREIAQTTPLIQKARAEASFIGITASGAGDAFKDAFVGAFTQIDQGFKGMMGSFLLSFTSTLQQMAAEYAASQLSHLFGNLLKSVGGALAGGFSFGGGASFGGGGAGGSFAEGGHYNAFAPRLVGERGPELDIPNHSGAIVSNEQVRRALGAGSAPAYQDNRTYNIMLPRARAENHVQRRSRRQMAEDIVAALR